MQDLSPALRVRRLRTLSKRTGPCLSRRPKARSRTIATMSHREGSRSMTPSVTADKSSGLEGVRLAMVGELMRRGARVAFVARTRERVDGVTRSHPGAFGIVGDVAAKGDIYPI